MIDGGIAATASLPPSSQAATVVQKGGPVIQQVVTPALKAALGMDVDQEER